MVKNSTDLPGMGVRGARTMAIPRLVVWDEAACKVVHEATLTLLRDTGVEVLLCEEGLELFRQAGADVDGSRVRFAAELVERAIASAPRTWTVRSRGSDATLELVSGNVYFGTGSDCLYVRDPDTGQRRRALTGDIEGMAALSEKLPNIDFVMSMGLPADVPQRIDDLSQMAAMLRGTRKPIMMSPRDGLVMARMEQMAEACGAKDSWMVYAMPSPPLMHDSHAVSKIIACAQHEIPLIYAPSVCCGTTGPASSAGAVLVGNAEVLSGLVLHQFVKPGAPFVYGAGVDTMDMRELTSPYVSPEGFIGHQTACDLAHFYGLPSFAYAGDSDSKLLDEQWAAEAAFTTMLGALSNCTLLHNVGYLELGLQSSYETIVLGDELVGFARYVMQDWQVDEESLALDEIVAVGPGGNHLNRAYTRKHHRDFWRPGLLDRAGFDHWTNAGATTLGQRVKAQTDKLRNEPRRYSPTESAERTLSELLAAPVPGRD